MAKNKRINVRVDDEVYNSLHKMAKIDRRKFADFVRIQLENVVLEESAKYRNTVSTAKPANTRAKEAS